ncbi:MAG: hypothetical protein GY906_02730 [bacterium]|nr:hypothetical protein [bacterium]
MRTNRAPRSEVVPIRDDHGVAALAFLLPNVHDEFSLEVVDVDEGVWEDGLFLSEYTVLRSERRVSLIAKAASLDRTVECPEETGFRLCREMDVSVVYFDVDGIKRFGGDKVVASTGRKTVFLEKTPQADTIFDNTVHDFRLSVSAQKER